MSNNAVGPNPSQPLDQRQRLLLRVLRARSARQLHRIVHRLHPADIAPLFPLLKPDEKNNLLEVLFEMRLAGRTLSDLDDDSLRQVLEEFPDTRLAVVLRRIPADDAVDLLDHLDAERRAKVLSTLDPALASRLHNLMTYGQDTAGGIMDPDVISFRAENRVEQTLEVIRKLAENRRLFYLYVTDDRGHLLGLVKLWQLITASHDQILRDVMMQDVISVQVGMPQEEVAKVFGRYDLPVMPVCDDDGILVGVITVDDVIDVIEEEASEDLYRLGGLPQPETLATPFSRSLRLRLPWLGMSLIGAILAAWVLASHQNLIAKYAVIVAFMHILGATGGDAGRQTLTVVTVAMATGELDLWRNWKVLGKQVLLGLVNGLITGAIVGLAALVLEKQTTLAWIVFVAQVANQTLAAATACSLPMLFSKIGLDPTLGTSTLIAALSDLIGFTLFLALASALL